MLRIGVKHKFGFQNTNTDFKTQMRVLILTFRLFQNNVHVDDPVKDKFGFQNPNTDFKTQIRILILTFCLFQNKCGF